jgi:hypothetical protein
MKAKTKPGVLPFPLNLLYYGNSYLIERIAALELAVMGQPTELQIDLMGEGEITAGWALLIRSILAKRSPDTYVTMNARSSLSGATVLVWLLGDQRLIREDAHVFFRRATASLTGEEDKDWEDGEMQPSDEDAEADPEEADYARVLQHINEFLPVKELAGRLIEVPLLRQFGLVENEKLDRFLADAFRGPQVKDAAAVSEPKPKRVSAKAKVANPGTLKE